MKTRNMPFGMFYQILHTNMSPPTILMSVPFNSFHIFIGIKLCDHYHLIKSLIIQKRKTFILLYIIIQKSNHLLYNYLFYNHNYASTFNIILKSVQLCGSWYEFGFQKISRYNNPKSIYSLFIILH